MARESVLVFVYFALLWPAVEWLILVESLNCQLMSFMEVLSLLLLVLLKIVLNVLEFREETAAVLELYIAALLDLTVEVGLDLALAPLADIARKQVTRQVS